MTVTSIHPGVTREQIADEHRLAGALSPANVAETPPPTARRAAKCCATCTPAPRAPTARPA